jgi:hypothetical protein
MAPRRLLHIVLWTVGGAAVVVALTAASLILRSELMLRHTYETPDVHLRRALGPFVGGSRRAPGDGGRHLHPLSW